MVFLFLPLPYILLRNILWLSISLRINYKVHIMETRLYMIYSFTSSLLSPDILLMRHYDLIVSFRFSMLATFHLPLKIYSSCLSPLFCALKKEKKMELANVCLSSLAWTIGITAKQSGGIETPKFIPASSLPVGSLLSGCISHLRNVILQRSPFYTSHYFARSDNFQRCFTSNMSLEHCGILKKRKGNTPWRIIKVAKNK